MSEEHASKQDTLNKIARDLFELRHDQRWAIDRLTTLSSNVQEMGWALKALLDFVSSGGGIGHTTIHVTAVELKPEESHMPPIDHMPLLQLPSSTVRAMLSVSNPRKADGSRVTSVTWSSSDESQVSLEAIPDSTVKVPDPNWVDPGDGSSAPLVDFIDTDGLPNSVFATYADTPLDAGDATVTVKAAGMADCDIEIKYSDPAVGHFAITGVQVPEA